MEHRYALGLDVAKLSVEACLLTPDGRRDRLKLANSQEGFQKLIGWLHGIPPEQIHACLEPTGRYSRPIANFLLQNSFQVSQVNSHAVSSYGRAKSMRSKTDKIDAFLLADFCLKENPPRWVPAAKAATDLREVEARIACLTEMIQQEENRLEAGFENPLVREEVESHLADLKTRKAKLEKESVRTAKADELLSENLQLLESVIGIGTKSALKLLAYVPFANFEDARAVGCFAGLTPRQYESGTSVHHRERISRIGNSRIRELLYYPALSAMQHNPQMREFAERLKQRGKPPKVIICAIMRKLLVLCSAILRTRQPYDVTLGLKLMHA